MNKLVNWFAGTLTAVTFLCGESLSPIALLALAALTSAFLWLSTVMSLEYKMHKYAVADAPIASQVARELNIEVQA